MCRHVPSSMVMAQVALLPVPHTVRGSTTFAQVQTWSLSCAAAVIVVVPSRALSTRAIFEQLAVSLPHFAERLFVVSNFLARVRTQSSHGVSLRSLRRGSLLRIPAVLTQPNQSSAAVTLSQSVERQSRMTRG